MEESSLFALGEGLIVEQILEEAHRFLVLVRSTMPTSCCPLCGASSDFIHSQYQRRVADVPCGGRAIQLRLTVRRFSCHNSSCDRAIFVERLPHLVQPWAQMTKRLREALCLLGFASCAQMAARLAPQLGLKGSASTVLRLQRTVPEASPEPFTKIGLDDFAFRRGRTYGTIIVDLETHRLIEVLPDRTVETVSTWLAAHPEIEVISRDRASDYATAATLGAPQATQICDRWHLVKNLSEYVMTFLARMRAQVRSASQKAARSEDDMEPSHNSSPHPETETVVEPLQEVPRARKKTALELAAEARKAQRLDQYQQVLTLYEQGFSPSQISPRVGISDRTVRQWLVHGIETRPRRRKPSPLDAYASYLRRRWEEGEQNGLRLLKELRAQGYTGSERALYRYLKRWKPAASSPTPAPPCPLPQPPPRKTKKTAPPPGPFDSCQAKQAVWLYMRAPEKLTPTEKEQLAFLKTVHPSLETAYDLVQAFLKMMHEQQGEQLDGWLEEISQGHISELIRFGKGIERDKAPVQAALSRPESNGVVEGHVHRLKLIKRQGYGRASFALLRKRVLFSSGSPSIELRRRN